MIATSIPSMTLLAYFTEVFEPKHRADRSAVDLRRYRRAIVAFTRMIGSETPIHRLNDQRLPRFENWLKDEVKGREAQMAAGRVWNVLHEAAPAQFPATDEIEVPRPREKPKSRERAVKPLNRHKRTVRPRKPAERLPSVVRSHPAMTLLSYLATYLSQRDVSDAYRRGLLYTVNYFDRWHGDLACLSDLSDDLLNRYLEHASTRMKPRSVKHHRTNLVALWRAAHDADLTTVAPRRVRKIKVQRTIPEAWTVAQMQLLLSAVGKVRSPKLKRCGVSAAAYLRAYILVSWDTGLRPSDLLILRFDEIGDDGSLVHVQSKTNDVKNSHLQPATIKAVDAIRQPQRKEIFGGELGSKELIRKAFRNLLKAAGMQGSPKKLRKSSATAVECIQAGAASRHLGHRTLEMAMRHYVDPRIAKPTLIQPPALTLESAGAP